MDLRNRLFPYPIIGEGYDDYKKTTFTSDINIDTIGNKINVNVHINLNNEDILKFIKDGCLIYAVHIECPETSYRNVFKSENPDITYEIEDSKISGKAEISVLLVCNKDIYNYTSYDFNEDYEGVYFTFEKGNIIGIGGQVKSDIDKNKEELGKIPSILSIIMKKGKDKDFNISLDGDKIKILLNEEDYANYLKIANVRKFQGIFHSMIAMPALIYVFDEMKNGGIEGFEYYRWFRSLKKSLERYKVTLNEETLKASQSVKLAQMILDMPLNRALSALGADEFKEDEE